MRGQRSAEAVFRNFTSHAYVTPVRPLSAPSARLRPGGRLEITNEINDSNYNFEEVLCAFIVSVRHFFGRNEKKTDCRIE